MVGREWRWPERQYTHECQFVIEPDREATVEERSDDEGLVMP